MKTRVIITMAVALAFLGWWLVSPNGTNRSRATYSTHESYTPPTTTNTDPLEVFQRAFWKRPTPADRILHAERREWKDANGVSKWQWCIAVQPSPALVKHLREDNAFGLLRGSKAAWQAPADWFPGSADGFTVLQSVSGSMTLLFSSSDDRLYATDSGGGFRPGAPEPMRPAPVRTAGNGRLPNSPPPRP